MSFNFLSFSHVAQTPTSLSRAHLCQGPLTHLIATSKILMKTSRNHQRVIGFFLFGDFFLCFVKGILVFVLLQPYRHSVVENVEQSKRQPGKVFIL